jgi:hypothetical protein
MHASKIFRAIHIKQLFIYFVAFWLVSNAFQVLACLFDVDVCEFLRLSQNPEYEMTNRNYDLNRLVRIRMLMSVAKTIGLILAFAYAIWLARSRNGNWINPTIAFLLSLILGFFNLLGWSIVKIVFLSPGSVSDGAAYYLINGFILLILGMAVLYSYHIARKRKFGGDKRMELHA